jgi:myosin heavy subunit
MKIHPLFWNYLANGFVPEKSSESFRSALEWFKAGMPLVEEQPKTPTGEQKVGVWVDCSGRMDLHTMTVNELLAEKDARIKELERSEHSWKSCADFHAEKVKDLEAKLADEKRNRLDKGKANSTLFNELVEARGGLKELRSEVTSLRAKLAEAEKNLDAIKNGWADAFRANVEWSKRKAEVNRDSIRNAALEEAAKITEDSAFKLEFAARIRALKKP